MLHCHFFLPLIQLGQVVGLEKKPTTADNAYPDSDESVLEQIGVHPITPSQKKSLYRTVTMPTHQR